MPATRHVFLLALAFTVSAACSSSDHTPGDGEATDTSNATDVDVPDDGMASADPGSGADDTSVSPTEICDDSEDNDRDGYTDCADSDCSTAGNCVENTDRLCSDDIDNDGDGDVDCDDSDCNCGNPCCWDGVLRGGECICGPQCTAPDWCVEDGPLSYIRSITIPRSETPAECCFDFDGDGNLDNGLALLRTVFADHLNLDAALDEAVANDELSLILEWERGGEEHGFWAYLATNDLDGSGGPDDDWATRASGGSVFQIKLESFDEYGSRMQFNAADDDGFGFVAGPSLVQLDASVEVADRSVDVVITAERAVLEGEYTYSDTGRASVDETFEIDGETVEVGGWKLGGLIPLDHVAEAVDDLLHGCDCAGFDPRAPVVTYGDDGTQYNLTCAQTPGEGCNAADGAVCENVSILCGVLPLLVGAADIDMDGNGVADSLSVGLRLSAVGATLTDPPVAPAEGSGEGSGG